MIQSVPRRSITVLGVLVMTVFPTVLIVALRHSLSWYTGFALFYGVLAIAEISYLGILIALMRRDRLQYILDIS
jgi:hypothetical protein